MSETIKDTIDLHIEAYQEQLDELLMDIKEAMEKDSGQAFTDGVEGVKLSGKIEALKELKKDLKL